MLWTASTRCGISLYKYWCKLLLLSWIASLSLCPPLLPPPLSPSFSLWRGDYGESGSWAQVSLPLGLMGCGTMTLLKFLRVFGFGDVKQRGKAKARLSPEYSCQRSLRLPGPAKGAAVAARADQRLSLLLDSAVPIWPDVNEDRPPLSEFTLAPTVERISGYVLDWWMRSGS